MYPNKHNNPTDEQQGLETVIQVKRVSKKTKGGNQMTFTALTVVGDKEGTVGVGLGKGKDVANAIKKSFTIAKRNSFKVNIINGTIPHEVTNKFGASKIFLKPAVSGTGLIAGGSLRLVLEACGITDIISKRLGTNNKTTNVYCVLEALKSLKK